MPTMQVPIVKGKDAVEIDLDKLPEEVYAEALKLGLKELANRGMSKITKAAHPDPEELKAVAMAKAAENVEAIYEGKIRYLGGAKKSKLSGAVMTEARRLARNVVKDAIKAANGKVSHYPAAEITKAANAYLETDDGAELIAQAKSNIEAREAKKVAIDIGGLQVSPKLVAAAEERKAKQKKEGAGSPRRSRGR